MRIVCNRPKSRDKITFEKLNKLLSGVQMNLILGCFGSPLFSNVILQSQYFIAYQDKAFIKLCLNEF